MKQIIVLFIYFSPLFAIAQVNPLGNPIVKNFDPITYRAAEQNWSITQDNRGVMYFGNHAGVLEYDGTSWRMIPISNNSTVRSLGVDDKGRVYVGAVGEFGYLEPDDRGKMKYVSLLPKIDSTHHDFSEVWKIYSYKNLIHFSTRLGFFTYNSDLDIVETNKYSKEFRDTAFPLFTFAVEDEIYLGAFINGLMKYENGEIVNIPNGDFFALKDIFSVLPYDNENILVCTSEQGVFLYNKKTSIIDDLFFNNKTQDLLKSNYLFHSITLPNNRFGFATDSGVIIADKFGNIEYIINTETGLQDQTAYFLYHNPNIESSPLWMTLNNGISYANIYSPIMNFNELSKLKGLTNDVIEFNNTLVVATTSGVYYLKTFPDKPAEFVIVEDVKRSAYGLDIWTNPITKEKMLIIATGGDVYIVDNKFNGKSITAQLENKTHNAFEVSVSKYYPGRIYIGLTGGLEYLEYVNGKWKVFDFKDLFRAEIKSIVEDEAGNLWLASNLIGFSKVVFQDNKPVFTLYNADHGLPNNLNLLKIKKYQGEILFATAEGIYNFNEDANRFSLDSSFYKNNEQIKAGYFAMFEDKAGNLWMSKYLGQQHTWIEKAMPKPDGSFEIESGQFKGLPSLWCDAVFVDNDNVAWFSISNQLFSFNNNILRNYSEPFNTLIRNVSTLGDSLLFAGTNFFVDDKGNRFNSFEQSELLVPVLNYQFNNLEIIFSSTFFESQEKMEYSYRLEGFDNWSRWSSETKAIYSYVPVGKYTFKVKARNVYGVESIPANFQFTVLPPWYRTIWAYIGYGIILVFVVYVIIILNTRRLIREKEILEGIVKERTAEVVKQKDELEIQRDKIAKQNENITNSIEYAKRIQTAALPPDDFIDQLIQDRFILFMPRDIVSGDFYWIGKMGEKVVVAAADCTGHGVPGGFMSMLGIAYLNQIVSSGIVLNAGQILDQLRDQVMKSLRQKDEASESRDGMDISLFVYDKEKSLIEFAGANNPLYIFRNGELTEIVADKMPIGIHRRADRNFVNNPIEVFKGDVIYTFSDGYKDQFGGAEGRKFMSKNFKELLLNIHKKPCAEQRDILEKTIIDWTGHHERIDDIIVMGVVI
jgi:serine phosphatase RsbU (regulator of sigma subunit)/ligand-binding sensor domain-containing protein